MLVFKCKIKVQGKNFLMTFYNDNTSSYCINGYNKLFNLRKLKKKLNQVKFKI